jgi:hypothetical protein
MKKLNISHLNVSLVVITLITVIFPTNPVYGRILRYNYGFPLKFITIYQEKITSKWFLDNFINGNKGLLVNVVSLITNIALIYFIIFLGSLFIKGLKQKS